MTTVNIKNRVLAFVMAIALMFTIISLPQPSQATSLPSTDLNLTIMCNRIHGTVGDTLIWSASPIGGKAPYQYSFYLYRNDTLVKTRPYSTNTSFSYLTTIAGDYKVKVFIKDVTTAIKSRYSLVVPVDGTAPLGMIINNNPLNPMVGDTLSFNVSSFGGNPPYTYSFKLYQDNILIQNKPYSTNQNFSFVPAEAGKYYVKAYAKDNSGQIISKDSSIVTVGDPSATPLKIVVISCNKMEAYANLDTLVWNSMVTGGYMPYTYSYELYKNNVLINTSNYASESSFIHKPTDIGIYRVKVNVQDSRGTIVFKSSGDVSVVLQNLTLAVASDKVGLKTNETVTWLANAYGGVAPYEFKYSIFRDGTLITEIPYTTNFKYVYKPTVPGTYKAEVWARDAQGKEVRAESELVTVLQYIPIKILSIAESTATPVVGGQIIWTVTASDGSIPYLYNYYVYKDGKLVYQLLKQSHNRLKYTPTSTGEYYLKVVVSDRAGYKATSSSTKLNVTGVTLKIASIYVNSQNVSESEEIKWSVTAIGGVSPLKYAFYLYKDGNRIVNTSFTTNNTFSYKPFATGQYYIKAYVKDASGKTLSLTDSKIVTVKNQFAISVKLNKTSFNSGEQLIATTSVSGGVAPYQYSFYLYNGSTLVYKSTYGTSNVFKRVLTGGGTYSVKAYARDKSGNVATIYSGKVNCSNNALSLVVDVNKSGTTVGDTAVATIKPNGGKLPYSYNFYVCKGAQSSVIKKYYYSKNASLTWKFTSEGTYWFKGYVKDANGVIMSSFSTPVIVTKSMSEPLQITAVKAVNNSISVGENARWNVTAFGGQGPYTFTYSVTRNGKVFKTVTNQNAYYSFTAPSAGDYKTIVSVVDQKGAKVSLASDVIKVIAVGGLNFNINASIATGTLGSTIKWNIGSVSGGKAPYQYCFYLYKNGTKIKTYAYSTNTAISYVALEAGTYKVKGYVKDAQNIAVSKYSAETTITVDPSADVVLNSVAVSGGTHTNDILTFTAKASGGTTPYKYKYELYIDKVLTVSTDFTNSNVFKHKAVAKGEYYAKVTVLDALNHKDTKQSKTVTITDNVVVPVKINVSVDASPTNTTVGNTITWNIDANGGIGTLQYAFYIYKDGAVISKIMYGASNTYSFKPSKAGTYKIMGYARDTEGNIGKNWSPETIVK